MKILCLFVRHGTEKYPDALTVLNQWYERHNLLDQRTLWIIDNAQEIECPPKQLGPKVLLRPGNNEAWEFSAWQRAIREAGKELNNFDAVHFVTSAFNTLYTAYLGHFSIRSLKYATVHGICLGHIDSYEQPVTLGGDSSQSWIRTCFFFLPVSLASHVATWQPYCDPALFFSSPELSSFRRDAPLSSDYQQRIRIWLEGHEVGGHTWHSPIASGHEEVERFQKKTLAILNEHNFSITLRKWGIQLADFCWLWSQRDESAFGKMVVPAEMDQLAIRRRILGIDQ